MIHPNASLSNDEFSKYIIQDAETQARFDGLIGEVATHDNEMDKREKRIEALEEQIYFAKELIGAIRYELKQTGNKRELIQAINLHLDDTNFET